MIGTSCYHAVAHVKHLERAEKQQKRRRLEDARQDATKSLIIDADFLRSAISWLVTPCCGRAFVPEDVDHCLAIKCEQSHGGCGMNFCGKCAKRVFGVSNIFRDLIASEAQWKTHYEKISKKALQ